MKTKVMQNLGGGGGRQRTCTMGDVHMENGLNTVGKRASYFCLKHEFEAVFLVKIIFLKELGELYLRPKRSKLIELI